MKEFHLQIIILTSHASSNAKVAMFSILKKVDWSTWQCTMTQKYLTEYCKIPTSTLKRALKELDELGWITRHTHRKGSKNTPTSIRVNVDNIKSLGQNEPKSNMSLGQNGLKHESKMNPPIGQNGLKHESKMDYITINNNINTINNNTDHSNSQHVESIEGGKEYYKKLYKSLYSVDIDTSATACTDEPTWQPLATYQGRELSIELTKRSMWLGVPMHKAKQFYANEKKREGL